MLSISNTPDFIFLGISISNHPKLGTILKGSDPQLVEEDIFKIIIPLSKQVEGLTSLLEIIKKHPGIKAKDIPQLLQDRSLKTVERQIKELKERSLIERRGSRKTGGYYFKDH